MSRQTVRIEGLARLRRQMEEVMPAVHAGARAAVEESGDAVRVQVARTVRVRTGRLRRGIRVRDVGAHSMTVEVGWFGRDEYYAKFVEFGTSSITADPVLTRAAEEERTRFPQRVTREIRERLEDL